MTMKVGQEEINFHWKNYFKPTPVNLERISTLIRNTIFGFAAINIVMENKWASLTLTVVGIVVDNMTKFFSSIVQQEEKDMDKG